MDEVREFAQAFKDGGNEGEYNVIKMVLGVAEQAGDYVEVEGIGKIDVSIADFIQALNEQGFKTLSSCSGLAKEHTKLDIPYRLNGYVSFVPNEKIKEVKKAGKKRDLLVKEEEVYLKPAISLYLEGKSDAEIEGKWILLRSELLSSL